MGQNFFLSKQNIKFRHTPAKISIKKKLVQNQKKMKEERKKRQPSNPHPSFLSPVRLELFLLINIVTFYIGSELNIFIALILKNWLKI